MAQGVDRPVESDLLPGHVGRGNASARHAGVDGIAMDRVDEAR